MGKEPSDEWITQTTRQALGFAALGGMKASLFIDTAEEDADMLMEEVINVKPAKKKVVVAAIEQWRKDFAYLANIPDNIKGE